MEKILVVVDMQNDFIDGPLGTPEARGIVDNVCKKIREGEWDEILLTYDTHESVFNPSYFETQEGKRLPIKHCVVNTDGWKLNDKVKTEVVDCKSTCYAINKFTFGSGRLVDKLTYTCRDYMERDLEITLVGVCTDICVVSNALLLKAHFSEARIVVDASCCAGTTPANHLMALVVMKSCQIDIENEPCAWLKLVD